MIASSRAVPKPSIAPPAVAASARPTRPFLWSVRRELWQYRAIVIGPLVAAGILGSSYLLGAIARPSGFTSLLAKDAATRHDAIGHPYALAMAMVSLGAFFAAVFYCIDALHSERRDRNLLFWKSLPVSDATVVLSKAAMVLVVLPLMVFWVTIALHAAMLLIGSVAMIATRGNPVALWRELPLLNMPVVLLYGVGSLAIQLAPLYAWFLMVSAWARERTVLWAFLWAFLPPYAIMAAEQMMYGHSRFREMLRDLLIGGFGRSFGLFPEAGPMRLVDHVGQLDPAGLFGRPATWIGLLVATAFLGIAILVRRNREAV